MFNNNSDCRSLNSCDNYNHRPSAALKLKSIFVFQRTSIGSVGPSPVKNLAELTSGQGVALVQTELNKSESLENRPAQTWRWPQRRGCSSKLKEQTNLCLNSADLWRVSLQLENCWPESSKDVLIFVLFCSMICTKTFPFLWNKGITKENALHDSFYRCS